jgi:hypothetical protein
MGKKTGVAAGGTPEMRWRWKIHLSPLPRAVLALYVNVVLVYAQTCINLHEIDRG